MLLEGETAFATGAAGSAGMAGSTSSPSGRAGGQRHHGRAEPHAASPGTLGSRCADAVEPRPLGWRNHRDRRSGEVGR
jgi:hypothetical protein